MISELQRMAEKRSDFSELDIHERHKEIIDGFIEYLRKNDLLQ